MAKIKPISAKPVSAKPPQANKPPQELERRDICFQALALARRAAHAGLAIVAYLLDIAAMEADAAIAKRHRPDLAGAEQD